MRTLSQAAFFASMLLTLSFANASTITPAIYDPMHIVTATQQFENVTSGVKITLTNKDDEPLMMLEYVQNGMTTVATLNIFDVLTDSCGAQFINAGYADATPNGPRYNVHLIDYTGDTCGTPRAWLWEANVREGFGWCGTMDSTMMLQGHAY